MTHLKRRKKASKTNRNRAFEERYDVRHNDPVGDDMPVCAFAVIDEAMTRTIVDADAFMRKHGLVRIDISVPDDQVQFYTDDDWDNDGFGVDRGPDSNVFLQINFCMLVVCQDCYWFEARGGEKFEGIELETSPVKEISTLAARFGIPYEPARSDIPAVRPQVQGADHD